MAVFVLIGSLACGTAAVLPGRGSLLVVLFIAIAVAVALQASRLQPVAVTAIGFAWTALAATAVLENRLANARWNEEQIVTVKISAFPVVRPGLTRFEASPLDGWSLPHRLRLSCYRCPLQFALGDTWRLRLRLRPPRGFANPGTFDYERWMTLRGIGATGYVVDPLDAQFVADAPDHGLDALRHDLASRIVAGRAEDPASGILTALAVGSRHHLDAESTEVFVRTGTSHLMAISGLHIGLAAGFGMLLGRLLTAMLAVVSARIPVRMVGAVVSLVAACGYGALAGFTLPTRRACLMLTVALLAWVFGRRSATRRTWALALLAVYALWPLASLGVAFQLSFAAVAILGFLIWREERSFTTGRYRILRFVRWQLLLTLLALPLTQMLFGRFSLVGPIANLFAIPFFSFIIVPSLGAGLALEYLGGGSMLLDFAHGSAAFGFNALRKLAALPLASVSLPVPSPSSWLFMSLALAVAVAPWRWTYRLALLPALLVAAIPGNRIGVAAGCVRISLYDVGQGSAALVETARHRLLFDTGPRFSAGSNAAQFVLIPSFAAAGITFVDEVLVSHDDADHSGGLDSILQAVEVGRVRYSGDAARYPRSAIRCSAGQNWIWDDIRFDVLHPAAPFSSGNDASCVLRVAAGSSRVLLTGDIERRAEFALIARDRNSLAADLVIVPHHGSATSSGKDFVAAVDPKYAWVAAGFRNRWGFPKADVVARWRASGAKVVTTGHSGFLSTHVCRDVAPTVSDGFRAEKRRFWRDET